MTDEKLLIILKRLVGRWEDFQASDGNMTQAYYILAKYGYRDWEDLKAFLLLEKP